MLKKNLFNALMASIFGMFFVSAYAEVTATISGKVYNLTGKTLTYAISPYNPDPSYTIAPAQTLTPKGTFGDTTEFSSTGVGHKGMYPTPPLMVEFRYTDDSSYCDLDLSYDYSSNQFYWGDPYCEGTLNGYAAGYCGPVKGQPNHYTCNFEILPAQ